MCLNIRKQNCQVFFMSAQDWQIAPTILRDCKVWMPVKDEDLEIVDEGGPSIDPANDPSNFRLVWHVWDDFPVPQGEHGVGGRPERPLPVGRVFFNPMYAEGAANRRKAAPALWGEKGDPQNGMRNGERLDLAAAPTVRYARG